MKVAIAKDPSVRGAPPLERQWIPVSERLPEPASGEQGKPPTVSADVLAYFDQSIPCEVLAYDHEAGSWFNAFSLDYIDGDVTHWMPLPPPPADAKGEGVTR